LEASPTPGPVEDAPATTATPTIEIVFGPTEELFTPSANNTAALFPFTLLNEAVTYTEHVTQGCEGVWVSGEVFGLSGESVTGLPIQVTGESFDFIEFSGSAPEWGESGYQVLLNTSPIEAEFEVRLLSTTAMPLSEPIVVRTLDSCERNVAVVNFVQNRDY
ncbi:MAG: hypothetical protein GYB68_02510, partial [Chloroflexi bacterium]|nr:hypothetical protein [Chloroflexota bacterium]